MYFIAQLFRVNIMPSTNYKKLLEDESGNAHQDIVGEWQVHYGGRGDFWVWGNLGGGEVHLEAAIVESAPCEICNTSIKDTSDTKSGVVKFYLAPATKIRAVLTGATSPTSNVFARVNT